jgi:hypothetical protein
MQEHHFVATEKSCETLIECDEAIAFRTVGFVPDDTVGKVAAAPKHRNPGLSRGTVDFDRANGDEAAEDVDDLAAGVSVRALQHPDQFAQDDRRHNNCVHPFDRASGFDGLTLIVPREIANENIRIDGDPHRPLPASIASCISSSETGR